MNKQSFRSKIFLLTMLIVMVASIFIVVISQVDFAGSELPLTNSQSLSTSINPGSPVQLQPNESQVFVANTSLQNIPITYMWSVENLSSVSSINGTDYLLVTCDNQAVFKFLSDNLDYCWLSVKTTSPTMAGSATVTLQNIIPPAKQTSQQASEQTENQQPDQQTLNQSSTSTQTTSVSDVLPTTANYVVESAGDGWYKAVNGSDGSVSFTSTNASYVLNSVTALGGEIFVKGELDLTNSVILPAQGTSLYSGGSGKLLFGDADGLIIHNDQVNIHDLKIQSSSPRTGIGITISGTRELGYEEFTNLKVWNWSTAIKLDNVICSKFSGIDTTYSFTALEILKQSSSNVFSNCLFANFGRSQQTIIIDNDGFSCPEGNLISNGVIFGGNIGVELDSAAYTKISNSIVDSWTNIGIDIAGGTDNNIVDSWIGQSSLGKGSIAIRLNTATKTTISEDTLFATNRTIYDFGGSSDLIISNNKFLNGSNVDIYSCASIDGNINGNDFSSSGSGIGVYLQNTESYTINDNTFEGKTEAVYIGNGIKNNVVGNNINGTLQTAVTIDGGQYSSVTSNSIIYSSQSSSGSYNDICLVDGSTYNSVSDNILTAVSGSARSGWGIYEASASDNYNIYSGNVVTGQTVGAIGIHGPNSVRGTNIPASG